MDKPKTSKAEVLLGKISKVDRTLFHNKDKKGVKREKKILFGIFFVVVTFWTCFSIFDFFSFSNYKSNSFLSSYKANQLQKESKNKQLSNEEFQSYDSWVNFWKQEGEKINNNSYISLDKDLKTIYNKTKNLLDETNSSFDKIRVGGKYILSKEIDSKITNKENFKVIYSTQFMDSSFKTKLMNKDYIGLSVYSYLLSTKPNLLKGIDVKQIQKFNSKVSMDKFIDTFISQHSLFTKEFMNEWKTLYDKVSNNIKNYILKNDVYTNNIVFNKQFKLNNQNKYFNVDKMLEKNEKLRKLTFNSLQEFKMPHLVIYEKGEVKSIIPLNFEMLLKLP